jgi:hypothetical protein
MLPRAARAPSWANLFLSLVQLTVLTWAALRVVDQLDKVTEKVNTIDGRLSRVEGSLWRSDRRGE